MITIYHNPRCSKSREGLALLEDSGKKIEVVKYLEDLINEDELKAIISKLEIKPIDLIRKNEAIWKSDYKGKKLTDQQIIKAMIEHPKLIERPIIVNNDKAVIGRPKELILDII
ncbi:arsenate reductase (glutaredoxin) [Winogradskyella marincola]|uniref:Arsenate reductase (Glutaredoxin) n=1 Tax=Winogradskyella marincola TaxID=3037795 RepID=A0ABT6G0M1_9FLAO|nr:arsenate reductase (glutaredoxin) [Winogradskyella sp. YYF002]MDG4715582.1 arsenate reductase (glutaredoxin) [Winogradskyella sp. YYF002]